MPPPFGKLLQPFFGIHAICQAVGKAFLPKHAPQRKNHGDAAIVCWVTNNRDVRKPDDFEGVINRFDAEGFVEIHFE
ncbi:hypothetical protein [Burkholderia pseudomallei]|uniref:hypothetical protein n=1 Tax=Burkholderia pseudomallei TaxID=28450 RepID=UPI0012497FB1|nr:hypothetical protein [Burkholderia pseudomallei]